MKYRNTPDHVASRMVNDGYSIADLDSATAVDVITAVIETAGYVAETASVLAGVDADLDDRRGAYRQLSDAVAVLVALRRYIGHHGIVGPISADD